MEFLMAGTLVSVLNETRACLHSPAVQDGHVSHRFQDNCSNWHGGVNQEQICIIPALAVRHDSRLMIVDMKTFVSS